jgi:hypothetical protein
MLLRILSGVDGESNDGMSIYVSVNVIVSTFQLFIYSSYGFLLLVQRKWA